jgi:hypothetical protein
LPCCNRTSKNAIDAGFFDSQAELLPTVRLIEFVDQVSVCIKKLALIGKMIGQARS